VGLLIDANGSVPPYNTVAYNYDGNADYAVVDGSVVLGQVHVAEWKHEGGNLLCRIDKGSWTSIPSGNTSNRNGGIRLGRGYVNYFDGKIFEAVAFSSVPSSTDQDLIAEDLFDWVGGEAPPDVVPLRVTQLPLQVIDTGSRSVRVTQLPIQVITLPVQPARVTQLPIQVPNLPRPVPKPTPLVPLAPVGEEFVFLTAVNRARSSKEQRARLVENPRHRYAYSLQLTNDEQRRRAYAYLYKNQDRELLHPMFHHWTRLLAETEPLSDRLYFDPAGTDLRVGEALAIFDVYTMEVSFHTVAELFADGARCEESIGRPVGEVHAVCPAPLSRFIRVPDLTMAEGLGEARVTIETTRDRVLQRVDNFVLPMLGDLPVLAVEPLGEANEILERGTEWLDTGLSIPSPRTKWRYGLMNGTREYKFDRETDFDFWRAMLDHLGGRQRTIRVPTFFNDLPLTQQPALGATELVTSNIQAFEYLMAGSYGAITIWRDIGPLHRSVRETRMVYDANGDPVAVRMLLDGSIGSSPGSNIIKAISYLNRMRMGSDSAVLSHHQNYSTITLELQAVNQ